MAFRLPMVAPASPRRWRPTRPAADPPRGNLAALKIVGTLVLLYAQQSSHDLGEDHQLRNPCGSCCFGHIFLGV
jgi:hypothetical protein